MIRKLTFLAAALAVAGAVPALAAKPCKPVNGHFEAVIVPPGPDCPGFCTAGRVWGGIQGEYEFVATGFAPAILLGGIPSAQFFAGQSVIALKSGDELTGTDSGTIDPAPPIGTGAGGFASLISFTGGTGAMAGATGQIRLRGEVTLEGTSGDYVGTLCKG
jgi:opacity protein-like surface antigen